jgi:hypothetical protein
MSKPRPPVRLTLPVLQDLKDKGFRYVLVKEYDVDTRLGFVAMNFFTLVPVRSLPHDPAFKGIYEEIESDILLEWAMGGDQGIKVFVEYTHLSA